GRERVDPERVGVERLCAPFQNGVARGLVTRVDEAERVGALPGRRAREERGEAAAPDLDAARRAAGAGREHLDEARARDPPDRREREQNGPDPDDREAPGPPPPRARPALRPP